MKQNIDQGTICNPYIQIRTICRYSYSMVEDMVLRGIGEQAWHEKISVAKLEGECRGQLIFFFFMYKSNSIGMLYVILA